MLSQQGYSLKGKKVKKKDVFKILIQHSKALGA